jgi:hypothetical protein
MLTLEALQLETPKSLEAKRVDCGQCPISMRCVVGDKYGATGWTYPCCGSTALYLGENNLLIVDCAKHNFWTHPDVDEFDVCPMCRGQMAAQVNSTTREILYLPTVHSRVSSAKRLPMLRHR